MREFNVGELVLLTLESPGPVGITDGLVECRDRIYRISRKKSYRGKGSYYELQGCVSEKGIPYAVTEDWIRPVKELKR